MNEALKTRRVDYDHTNTDPTTIGEAQRLIGRKATLPLTGTIVDARETPGVGVALIMEVDERWGFGKYRLGMDRYALEIEGE